MSGIILLKSLIVDKRESESIEHSKYQFWVFCKQKIQEIEGAGVESLLSEDMDARKHHYIERNPENVVVDHLKPPTTPLKVISQKGNEKLIQRNLR